MATLVLGTVGNIFGGQLGGAIGSFVGSQIDQAIIGNGPDREGARLAEISVQTSSYGTAIAQIFGNMRVAGSVIWATDLQENSNREGGGKGRPANVTFSYSANFAVALSSRPIERVGRIWADGNLLRGAAGDFKSETIFRFYSGEEDQSIDPLIASAEGLSNSPAHRGIAYAVFENFQLDDFGNRIPSLTFEIINGAGQIEIVDIASDLSDGLISAPQDRGVTPISITGYAASHRTSREAIDNLLAPLPLWLRANDAVLEVVDVGQSQIISDIANEAASQNQEQFDQAQIITIPINEIPKEYGLRYYDPLREYQAGLQNSNRPGPGRRNVTVDFPAAIDANIARNIAQSNQMQENFGRHSLAINLVRDDKVFNSGDIVTILSMPYFWQIQQVEQDLGVLNLEMRAVSLNGIDVNIPSFNASGRSILSRDERAGKTIFHILDLPAFSITTAQQPSIAAAAAGAETGWRRANLFQRDGGNITAIDMIRTSAVLGSLKNAIKPASPYLVDNDNIATIRLASENMMLPISLQDNGLGAIYYAMIGQEIIIFENAIINDDGDYELRGLCRGVGGTEIAAHNVGERFILLDNDQLHYLNSDNYTLGQSLSLEASGLDDEVPQTASIQSVGRSMIPFAPVHGNVIRGRSGERVIKWIRRARVVSAWNDGVDIALYEDSEQYAVNIAHQGQTLVDDVVVRNEYPIGQSNISDWQDLGIGTVDISIIQIGTYARSAALSFSYDLL